MEKKKLVYWARYNQHYRIIAVETDNKIVKMVVSKNKKDKSITRDMIARVELCPDWQFICMKNQHITAESNFINSMRCNTEYARKINELIDFKRNGLVDSDMAMKELSRIFHQGFRNVKSDKDRHFRNKVKALYEEILTEQTRNDNKRSYDQKIPSDVIALAKEKGLLIERNDDYITKKGSRVKPTKKELVKIRAEKPCGYLIRSATDKKVIASVGYKFTSRQIVEFVQKYNPNTDIKENDEMKKYENFEYVYDEKKDIVYKVIFNRHADNTLVLIVTDKKHAKDTIDDVFNAGYNIEIKEFARKETPFEWFYRMSQSEKVSERVTAAKFESIEGIPEMNIVIDVLKKMVASDPDTEVIRVATDSLKRLGAVDTETVVTYTMKNENATDYATLYNEFLDSLDGRLHNKKQKRFEKSELSIGIPIETLKKIKSLGANVCVIRTVNKNGYNITRYPVSKVFHTINEIDKWVDNELANRVVETDNSEVGKPEIKKSETPKSNKRELVMNEYIYWTCQYTGAVKIKVLKVLDDDKALVDTAIKKQAPIVRDIKFIFNKEEHAKKAMKDWEHADRKRRREEKAQKKAEKQNKVEQK